MLRMRSARPTSSALQPCARVSNGRVALRVYSSKGFGKQQKVVQPKGDCPCRSNLPYETCCKPYHTGAATAPTAEATVRARFSAYSKGIPKYVIDTTHPAFHAYHYQTADGAAAEKLAKDVAYTCDNFYFGTLKVLKVEPGKDDDDAYVQFRYSLSHRILDALPNGTIVKSKTNIERCRFFREAGVWQIAEYELVELPDTMIQKAQETDEEAKKEAGKRRKEEREAAAA